MKRYLVWAGFAVAFVVGAFLIGELITSTGSRAVAKMASDLDYCAEATCTEDEIDLFYLVAESSFDGASPMLINWCVGIDDIAGTRVHRGGFIKSIFVWVGRLPCGRFANEEGAQ